MFMTMKRIVRYIIVLALTCMSLAGAQARTLTINPGAVRGDLTQYLREVGASTNYKDTVLLDVGKGSYTIDGSVIFHCHLIIKGRGEGESTVVFDQGRDRGSFKAFIDDCFIDVFGTLAHPLSLSISDISFRVKEHKGIWWEHKSNYMFKIRHCNSVNINRVTSYNYNASLTNFNLHVCSNVNFTDCDITNYNNSDNGGCLWLRGEMHNISIKRNKFTKYGKDEAVAVFDRLVDNSKQYIRGTASRTDIFIEDNDFYYGYDGKDKNVNSKNDMIFSLYTDHQQSKDRCMTLNFHLKNNRFNINEMTTRCMYIGFDPADVHQDIYIENNQIVNNKSPREVLYYRGDIEIHDLSGSKDAIHINNNNVLNNDPVMNDAGTTGYTFLIMRGGNVSMASNTVVNNVAREPRSNKPYGVQLVWCKPDGNSKVTMTGNVCKGLDCVAHVGAWQTSQQFSLTATNNYFSGNTRVYCDNIVKLDLNFTGNTFNSSSETFFLQEFASKGTVIFNNNEVTVAKGNGQFMTHKSSKGSTRSMRFDKLEVKNNVIKGVKNEQEMLKNVTNVGKRKLSNNRLSR